MWLEEKESTYGLNEYVASKVQKNQNGTPSGPNPTGAAIKEFFAKIDEEATDEELDMLDLAFGLTDTSRLGCQVCMSKALDGVVVRVPEGVNDQR